MTNLDIPKGLGIMAVLLASILVLSVTDGNGIAVGYPKEDKGYSHDYGMMKGMLKPGLYAAGTIASMQNDENGNPTWIVSGHWKSSMAKGEAAGTGANVTGSATFKATFDMVMTNGSAQHDHQIYNFTLTDVSIPDNSTMVFNGTATITMREGPVEEVPITITVNEGNVISISPDPNMINNHFGDTPIHGIVKKAINIMK